MKASESQRLKGALVQTETIRQLDPGGGACFAGGAGSAASAGGAG
jgi:hypothetical protein